MAGYDMFGNFSFGGGKSGGGGASGGWSASPVVKSSPPPPQKKSEKKKQESQNISSSGGSDWVDVGGGGNLYNETYIGGTVQTRGGGFTPDGSYSTGYQGSGEAPWITGESDPGIYGSGSFGAIYTPDLSNPAKVGDYNRYLQSIGLLPLVGDLNTIASQYNKTGSYTPSKEVLAYQEPGKTGPRIGGTPENLFPSIYDADKSKAPEQTDVEALTPTPVPTPALTPSQSLFGGQSLGKDNQSMFSDINPLNSSIAKYTSYTPTYQTSKTNAYQRAVSTYNDLMNKANMFEVGKDTYNAPKSIPNPVPTPTNNLTYNKPTNILTSVKQQAPTPTPTPAPKPHTEVVNKVLRAIPTEYHEPARQNIPIIVEAFTKRGASNPNQIAYALATTQAESGYVPKNEIRANPYSYNPRERYIAQLQNNYDGGWRYHGRGYTQLTHKYNYEDMDRKLGLGGALVANPDLANDPQIAADIMAQFFQDKGVNTLAGAGNFVAARGPVNGTDKAWEIASVANNIKNSLPDTLIPTPSPTIASLFGGYVL